MGMGVDIRSIKQIVHIEPPRTIREYVKEIERAGRDGTQSEAILYYDNQENKLVIKSEIIVDWKGTV